MKKFSLIYKLSFLTYLAFEILFSFKAFIKEYRDFTEHIIIFIGFLAIPAFIYQLIYIAKLGKNDNVSVKKSIGQFFLYFFLSISASILVTYSVIYFKGYTVYAFLPWSASPDVYYGAEAWYRYSSSWYFPRQFLVISAAYAVIYFITSITCKKREEADDIKKEKITFLTILPLLIMLLIVIFALSATKN